MYLTEYTGIKFDFDDGLSFGDRWERYDGELTIAGYVFYEGNPFFVCVTDDGRQIDMSVEWVLEILEEQGG